MAEEENMPREEISEEVPQSEPAPETEQVPEGEAPGSEGAEGAQTPAEDASSADEEASERSSNRKKVIIGVSVVVALIVIFIIILLLLLGSCTHRHSMEHVEGVAATCETPGVIDHWHCDECDKDYLDEDGKELITDIVIPAYGHVLATIEGKEPSCTEPGKTEGKRCVSCNEIVEEQEVIPALGHAYREGEYEVIQEPTCTEAGVKEYVCMRCGEEQKESIPALGHAEPVIKGREEPTCTEEGYSGEVRCSRCNELFEEGKPIPALGHDWGAPVVTRNPGCIYPGEEVYTCMRCSDEKTENIPALGHDRVSVPDVEPKCETAGVRGRVVCDRCGMVLEEGEIIPPLGHEIVDNECINKDCDATASEGLKFLLSDDKQYYEVVDIGTCTDTHILVPDLHEEVSNEFGELPVRNILNSAFANCSKVVTISIPDGVWGIGSSAFAHCPNLTYVTLGREITHLGANVFDGCEKLTGIKFKGTTSGWWVTRSPSAGEGISVSAFDLQSPQKAVELFCSTYVQYDWYCGGGSTFEFRRR